MQEWPRNRIKYTISPVTLIHAGMLGEACALLMFGPVGDVLVRLFPSLLPTPTLQAFAVIAALIAGIGNVLVVVSTQTLIQRETEDARRGRVYGSFIMIVNGVGLPIILGLSRIGAHIRITTLLTWLSIGITVLVALSFSSIMVHLRRRPHPPGSLT